jgi:O-antigen ligase
MNAHAESTTTETDWMDVLTKIALIVALVLVCVRITSLEVVRDTFDLGPAAGGATGPGATTTLLLDLLTWIPTLLILLRRAIDRRYTLRLHVSHLLMVLLAGWVAASCFWATDKFQAVINASTWCAAMSLGWAMCQLVRSWTRFRIVMSIAIALCCVFVAQATAYKLIEAPETVRSWEQMKPEIMKARNWTENDFELKQFERKVKAAELVGFYRSTNTYAAAAAMVLIIAGAFAIQRWRDDRDEPLFPVLIALPALACVLVVVFTDSRTALAGMFLCAVLFSLAMWKRDLLARRSRTFFAIAVGAVLIGIGVLVAIGLNTGALLHDSLTFRWYYWVGSWQVFVENKLLGVGWGSFGNAYLPHRLPIASEEIKDPHNALIKFLTETGIVGLSLAVAWFVRTAWELTRPVLPRESSTKPAFSTAILIAVPLAFLVVRVIVTYPLSVLYPELPKVVLYALGVAVGMIIGTVRSRTDLASDDRPAPVLLLGALVALAGFFLHAMVDFAMFENGPVMLMMLVIGSALGVRHAGAAGRKQHTGLAVAALGIVFCGVMAFVATVFIPIASAEASLNRARDLMGQQRYSAAVVELRSAMASTPVPNADYARRCAQAMMLSQRADPKDVLAALTDAIAANPADPLNWLERARFRRMLPPPQDVSAISGDYFQGISRNPSDVRLRIEFADFLASAGRRDEAAEQYKLALEYNEKLHPDEPKRLRAEELDAVRARISN